MQTGLGNAGAVGRDNPTGRTDLAGSGTETVAADCAMSIDLKQWERRLVLRDGKAVHVRAIRPEDETLYSDFFAAETADDLRSRFFGPVKQRDHAFFSRFTDIDYAKAMAFIALDECSGEMLGVARLHDDADASSGLAEFAIIVRSDRKGRGLGWQLMQLIVAYARAKGLRAIKGQVLHENRAMLDMCKELGFAIRSDPDAPSISLVELALDPITDSQGRAISQS
jgi:acetyltransferase